jgi:hypothetical protein
MATEFLKEIGLLREVMQCDSCGTDMTWSVRPNVHDGFGWRCYGRTAGAKCDKSASIRRGTWFQKSKLTLLEILLITYDVVCREPAHRIQYEYGLGTHTVADWGMFCRETRENDRYQIVYNDLKSNSIIYEVQVDAPKRINLLFDDKEKHRVINNREHLLNGMCGVCNKAAGLM